MGIVQQVIDEALPYFATEVFASNSERKKSTEDKSMRKITHKLQNNGRFLKTEIGRSRVHFYVPWVWFYYFTEASYRSLVSIFVKKFGRP